MGAQTPAPYWALNILFPKVMELIIIIVMMMRMRIISLIQPRLISHLLGCMLDITRGQQVARHVINSIHRAKLSVGGWHGD